MTKTKEQQIKQEIEFLRERLKSMCGCEINRHSDSVIVECGIHMRLRMPLEQQLSDMRTALDLVSGALVDSGSVPVPSDIMKYGEAVRKLRAEIRFWMRRCNELYELLEEWKKEAKSKGSSSRK